MEWIRSDDKRYPAWCGSYARKTLIKADVLDIDIVPGNHVIGVGDPKQPHPRFYGGGYPLSDFHSVEPHNLNRLVRGSTAHDDSPQLTSVFSVVALFLSSRNSECFVGDLEERFRLVLKKKGRGVATIWFWREIIHSSFSLAFDALKRFSGLEKLSPRIGG